MTIQTIRRTAKTLPVASLPIIRKDWRRDFALMDAACEALDTLAPSVLEGQHTFQMELFQSMDSNPTMRASAQNEMWRLLNECAPKGYEFRCGKQGWELTAE